MDRIKCQHDFPHVHACQMEVVNALRDAKALTTTLQARVKELEENQRLTGVALDEIMQWVRGSKGRLGRGGGSWREHCEAIVYNLREKGVVKGDQASRIEGLRGNLKGAEASNTRMREALKGIADISPQTGEDAQEMYDIATAALQAEEGK